MSPESDGSSTRGERIELLSDIDGIDQRNTLDTAGAERDLPEIRGQQYYLAGTTLPTTNWRSSIIEIRGYLGV